MECRGADARSAAGKSAGRKSSSSRKTSKKAREASAQSPPAGASATSEATQAAAESQAVFLTVSHIAYHINKASRFFALCIYSECSCASSPFASA